MVRVALLLKVSVSNPRNLFMGISLFPVACSLFPINESNDKNHSDTGKIQWRIPEF
jgi:hypothetical protein